MKIHLNQQEIEAAILLYVGNQGITLVGQHATIEMTAGRGANGMSATVDITNAETRVTLVPIIQQPEVEKNPAQMDLPFNKDPEITETAVETPDADKPLFGN